ncbi:uncharacterized protein N7483_011381 [Penicillium malachiteum]|uniref:uncharacterized protein n=1 Tax=Penicillium malachiteum TaxID=1324776 RepID=UPI0025470AF9|nr:uncharacterized protein N7483_011381 [Penicillium malachiteum]KAJ5714200.1 hypothetical protein N7483_011381 [Penicillium malachiteum]
MLHINNILETMPIHRKTIAPLSKIHQSDQKNMGNAPVSSLVSNVFGGSFFSPFVRARAPELEETWPITETEFLKFLDDLNESFIANPALQAADGIRNLLGFAPSATLQIVGGSMKLAAELGTVAASKIRTKKYMKKANAEIFEPKGLHARLCKTEKMLAMAGLPNDKNLFMPTAPTPLGPGTQNVPQPPPGEDIKMVIRKRMAALGDNFMPFSLDNVAPPAEQKSWMKKMGQKAAADAEKEQLNKMHGLSDRKDVEEEQEKVQKVQRKINDLLYRMQSMNPSTKDYRKKQEDLRRDMGDLNKDLRDAERDLQKELNKAMGKDGELQAKMKKDGGKKQAKEANKILWLVIADKKAFTEGDDDWDSDDGKGSDQKGMSVKQSGSGRSIGTEEKKSRRWWSKK